MKLFLADSSVNTIRLADRSRRCFVLGLMAAIPVLGLPAAVEAARLFIAAARETGEEWRHGRFAVGMIAGWLLLAAAYPLVAFTLTLGLFLIEIAVLFRFFVLLVRKTRVRLESPSRRWLYAGLGLAYFQAFTLLPLISFACFWARHRLTR